MIMFVLLLAVVSLIVSMTNIDFQTRLTKIIVGIDFTIAALAFLLMFGLWFDAHLVRSPYGSVILKGDDDVERDLQMFFFANVLFYSLPLMAIGLGRWLRGKFVKYDLRHDYLNR